MVAIRFNKMKLSKKITINSRSSKYFIEFKKANRRNFIDNIKTGDIVIIDKKVQSMHKLNSILPKNSIIKISANEKSKSFENLDKVIRKILSYGFKKNNKLIIIGGGISQDIGSFISSIIFRGVDWIFYPTSFLSQCDSCIGGKTSINFHEYKNQLGNFNPPKRIIIDINFLKSQSSKEIRSGVGEMAHYFLVSGNGDTSYFLKNFKRVLVGEKKISEAMINKSLKIKKYFIEKDEFDKKERLLLNYGHTYGHALEALTKYYIPHGIAVAHGINIANYISYKKKFINENYFLKIKESMDYIIDKNNPKTFDIKKYLNFLKKDKKNINNNLRCILTKGPGKMFIYEIKFDENLISYLKEYFNNFLIKN